MFHKYIGVFDPMLTISIGNFRSKAGKHRSIIFGINVQLLSGYTEMVDNLPEEF